jgi:hypothetical protein
MELQELDRKGSTHLEEKRLGGNVDLGLLLQSSKDQRVWVEGLGDLVVLSLQQWRRENVNRAGQSLRAGGRWRGIYTPPEKLAVFCPLSPETPVGEAGNSGPTPG